MATKLPPSTGSQGPSSISSACSIVMYMEGLVPPVSPQERMNIHVLALP